MTSERLRKQLAFIVEIDELKNILRKTKKIADPSQYENDAEHSWHLALMAIILAEHAEADIDLGRVVKMVLVHDLVEIDAGDTFAYDEVGLRDKADRERKAARRIFGLLPDDQEREMHALWHEFEFGQTPEAKFATALDRLQPIMHNYHTQGEAWQKHDINVGQVIRANEHIRDGSRALWEYTERIILDSVVKRYLRGDPRETE